MNDFNEVTKYLLNHIQKTYTHGSDVKQALKNLTEYDLDKSLPVKRKSTSNDATTATQENKVYELINKAEVAQYVKSKNKYDSNKGKACALLWQGGFIIGGEIESLTSGGDPLLEIEIPNRKLPTAYHTTTTSYFSSFDRKVTTGTTARSCCYNKGNKSCVLLLLLRQKVL